MLKLSKFRLSGKHFRIIGQHPSFRVPLATFGLLIFISLGAYLLARQTDKLPPVTDAKIVIVSHDKQQQIVPSKEKTVGDLLGKLSIHLNEGDVVEPAVDTHIDQDEFRINVYRAVPVEVVDGDNKTFAFSASTTPRAIAVQTGSTIYPEDIVTADPVQDFVASGSIGEQISIKRSTPVDVDLYGAHVTLRTQAKTIREMINEKGIQIKKNDKIVPAPDTPISPGQKISFLRSGTKTVTVTEAIPMPVQNIPDASLAYGTTAIRQQGSPGEQVVTYEITLNNNVETGRKVIQKVITKTPVKQIAVVGTSLSGIKGDMALAGISPGDYNYVDYIISHESGWCPTKAQGQWGGCPAYTGYVPPYGGYGLCQATPGSKMATAGADWATNPITQLRWCSGYAIGRYGSWGGAYNFWLSHHYW